MKCFYHSADLDGKCAGAIVKYHHKDVELIPINYGNEYDLDKIEQGETVFMVDFGFQPFSLMEKLNAKADLIWIDHHKTALRDAKEADFNCNGMLDVEMAGCELTWKYLFPNKPIPRAVMLLGRYDVWDHGHDPDIMDFQYGMRLEDTEPDNQEFWQRLFTKQGQTIDIIKTGRTILSYQRMQNEIYIKARGFDVEFEGLRFIACNAGLTNSLLFDSIYNEECYDGMMSFSMRKNMGWTVSMYSTKKSIDVGAIAKKHGGGGHPGAAGFQCADLPFKIKT